MWATSGKRPERRRKRKAMGARSRGYSTIRKEMRESVRVQGLRNKPVAEETSVDEVEAAPKKAPAKKAPAKKAAAKKVTKKKED